MLKHLVQTLNPTLLTYQAPLSATTLDPEPPTPTFNIIPNPYR